MRGLNNNISVVLNPNRTVTISWSEGSTSLVEIHDSNSPTTLNTVVLTYTTHTQSVTFDPSGKSQEGENGESKSFNSEISAQEIGYGITTIALSISAKTELFRILEGSKNMPKYFIGSSNLGMRFGFIGLGITTIDGFTNPNGWENHHTADFIIQSSIMTIATFFPGIGWVAASSFFVGDLIFQYYHNGKSITEYHFDKP